MATTDTNLDSLIAAARERLDQHTVETVRWHFDDATGSSFWLEKKKELDFDPLTDVNCYDDLKKFPLFEDEWLRGGPVERWRPKAYADNFRYDRQAPWTH